MYLRGALFRHGDLRKQPSLCAAKVCKLVLAEVVRDEVAETLLVHAERLPSREAEQLMRITIL